MGGRASMKTVFRQILLSAVVLYSGQTCFVANGQDEVLNFEQMKKKREEANKAFESLPTNTPIYSSVPQPDNTAPQNNEPHQYSFEATPFQGKSNTPKEQEPEAESKNLQLSTTEEPMIESPDYIHKLSRALPCFKQFIGNLYQVRYKRDSEITGCATNGNEACAHKEASEFEQTSASLTDKFYQCLDSRETSNQTAGLSR